MNQTLKAISLEYHKIFAGYPDHRNNRRVQGKNMTTSLSQVP